MALRDVVHSPEAERRVRLPYGKRAGSLPTPLPTKQKEKQNLELDKTVTIASIAHESRRTQCFASHFK